MAGHGHDIKESMRLLDLFQETQELHVAGLERLRREFAGQP